MIHPKVFCLRFGSEPNIFAAPQMPIEVSKSNKSYCISALHSFRTHAGGLAFSRAYNIARRLDWLGFISACIGLLIGLSKDVDKVVADDREFLDNPYPFQLFACPKRTVGCAACSNSEIKALAKLSNDPKLSPEWSRLRPERISK